jgi:hypothetical protein
VSFPVAGTMMIEPTESESKAELDRFCDAMIAIREEIAEIEQARMPRDRQRAQARAAHRWTCDRRHVEPAATRERAALPDSRLDRERKFWPAVSRVDNAYGDRNLFCLLVPAWSTTRERHESTSRPLLRGGRRGGAALGAPRRGPLRGPTSLPGLASVGARRGGCEMP